MATEKGKAANSVQFKSKSHSVSGRRFLAVTLLIEETGIARRSRNTDAQKKPLILDYMDNYLRKGASYGFGDWAVKAVELEEDAFKSAYEQL